MAKQKPWLDRYHDYEIECRKAARIEDDAEKSKAYERCEKLYTDMRNSPDAPKNTPPSRSENIQAQLIAWLVLNPRAEDCERLSDWIDRNFANPSPQFCDEKLERWAEDLRIARKSSLHEVAEKTEDEYIESLGKTKKAIVIEWKTELANTKDEERAKTGWAASIHRKIELRLNIEEGKAKAAYDAWVKWLKRH
ncbi:MAG: hypothetical protein SGI77_04390 [Pirellulaceae bacterium]|nr:hypothetical protein [Pirellulaceae bacterium]